MRQAADFANFRKHSMATHTELILNGGKKVLESLLPILDDMERAEANLAKSEEVETLREGLSLIFQKLQRTLEQQGLKKMETKEAQFDTDFHEAVALFPTEDEQQKESHHRLRANRLYAQRQSVAPRQSGGGTITKVFHSHGFFSS